MSVIFDTPHIPIKTSIGVLYINPDHIILAEEKPPVTEIYLTSLPTVIKVDFSVKDLLAKINEAD